jgi:Uma2 family endonuclease
MSLGFAEFTAPLPFPVRRFSVEEYHRLGETGILSEDDSVELLEGLVAPKMIRTPVHDAVVAIVEQALRMRLPPGWTPRVQSAITTATSEPEPDVALVRGEPRDYLSRHPSGADIALIVEVADSSLARDRAKARIYAAASVPVYWIVNLADDWVEVHTRPDVAAEQFLHQTDYRRGEDILLSVANGVTITLPVMDLLP